MFILWRYIIKEHIGPFIFSMSVISLMFILNLLFRELSRILSRGLSFGLIVEYFFLNMAWIVALAVPMSVLVATLMAFGRFSGDSEIVAMKAGGVSVPKIIFPVLFMAGLLTWFLIWFNNHVLPDFNHRTRLLSSDIARKRPTLSLEPGVYQNLEDFNLLIKEIREVGDTSYVKSVFIDDSRDRQKSVYILADSGKIYVDMDAEALMLILFQSQMHELDLTNMDSYRIMDVPIQKLNVSIENTIMQRTDSSGYRGDREKSAQMMQTEVADHRKELSVHQKNIGRLIDDYFADLLPFMSDSTVSDVAQKTIQLENTKKLGAGKTHRPSLRTKNMRLRQQLSGEINIIASKERNIYQLLVEIYKKYSIPFACIVFVLVGAPLGIMAKKGNITVAVGISFGFFLLYWSSLIGGEELADNQIISPMMAMWLANIIVGIGGFYLVLHSIFELSFRPFAGLWSLMGSVVRLLKVRAK